MRDPKFVRKPKKKQLRFNKNITEGKIYRHIEHEHGPQNHWLGK